MIPSAVEHFIARIRNEPALAAKLKAAGCKSVSDFSAAVITLASAQGISLSVADLEAWIKANTPPEPPADEELSDAQLDAVAGGFILHSLFMGIDTGVTAIGKAANAVFTK